MHQTLPSTVRRAVFVQEGSRLHYTVPLALQMAGLLERVYADWYGPPGSLQHHAARIVRLALGDTGKRMMGRYNTRLDSARVFSHPLFALRHHLSRRRFASALEFNEWSTLQFAQWILRKGFGAANTLMGFVHHMHPVLLETAQQRGFYTMIDQIIAPASVVASEAQLQQSRFPDWENAPGVQETRTELEQRTWPHCSHITCASEYVKQGLIAEGIAENRISVVAYPIDCDQYGYVERGGRSGPVVVGFVGSVGLRKGAPYFLEAARRLKGPGTRFVMVGPHRLKPAALKALGEHVEIVGGVPRSEVASWLREFDIFFFPSTCEGSATSIMEAMASGLPVVTTPNSGSVIEHGKDGFVHAYTDGDGLTRSLESLIASPSLRQTIGQNARETARQHTVARYGAQLKAVLEAIPDGAPAMRAN